MTKNTVDELKKMMEEASFQNNDEISPYPSVNTVFDSSTQQMFNKIFAYKDAIDKTLNEITLSEVVNNPDSAINNLFAMCMALKMVDGFVSECLVLNPYLDKNTKQKVEEISEIWHDRGRILARKTFPGEESD